MGMEDFVLLTPKTQLRAGAKFLDIMRHNKKRDNSGPYYVTEFFFTNTPHFSRFTINKYSIFSILIIYLNTIYMKKTIIATLLIQLLLFDCQYHSRCNYQN